MKIVRQLEKAVDALDRARAEEICDRFIKRLRRPDNKCSSEEVRRVLATLRRKRYFGLLQRVADALIQTGHASPHVRRHYAQALIDQNTLAAAIAVLKTLIADTDGIQRHVKENQEARGLLGRAYKQIYVDADEPKLRRNRSFLRKAARQYYDVYKKDPGAIWHGINTVALVRRARDDGVRMKGMPRPKRLARQILEQIERKKPESLNMWDLGTAAEACIAMGRFETALAWAVEYVKCEEADAFELASTLRQAEQVWRLKADGKSTGRLIDLLRSQLLHREGGGVTLQRPRADAQNTNALLDDAQFERILGHDGFRTFTWYSRGIARARCVGRVETRNDEGMGTGFLVAGESLSEGLTGKVLYLTNNHVIGRAGEDNMALLPEQAQIRFELLNHMVGGLLQTDIIWTSPRNRCDATLIDLTTKNLPAKVDFYPLGAAAPRTDGKQRVYIIGHPEGKSLRFSLHDNKFLDFKAPLMHYRAPTQGGSSGSPVFNEDWDLIGLHHAGFKKVRKLNNDGFHAANEGIWIRSIIEELNASDAAS